MLRRLSAFALASVAFGSATALAQEQAGEEDLHVGQPTAYQLGEETETRFGEQNHKVISQDFQLAVTHTTTTAATGADPDPETRLALRPAGDYFVIDGLSIGAQVGLTMTWGLGGNKDNSSQAYGIAPRVGYNIPLGSKVSLWPRVYFGYELLSVNVPPLTGNQMTFGAFVPLLAHFASHFFVGFGPAIDMELAVKIDDKDQNKDMVIGAQTTVGGWWGNTGGPRH